MYTCQITFFVYISILSCNERGGPGHRSLGETFVKEIFVAKKYLSCTLVVKLQVCFSKGHSIAFRQQTLGLRISLDLEAE